MSEADSPVSASSYGRRTQAIWIGYDKWRGQHLADTYGLLRLVHATMNGRPAYAVIAGDGEHVTWDDSKPQGTRLAVE